MALILARKPNATRQHWHEEGKASGIDGTLEAHMPLPANASAQKMNGIDADRWARGQSMRTRVGPVRIRTNSFPA
jgi:hypothetical protein